MRDHLRAELASTALLMAAQRQRPAKGPIAHSDRGSQYASGSYRALLGAWGMRQSMSRKGCCYDNAPMESFFHTLKVELVHRERFATREGSRPLAWCSWRWSPRCQQGWLGQVARIGSLTLALSLRGAIVSRVM